MTKSKVFIWTLVWLLQIALVGVLVPSDWLEEQITSERQMTANWLGRDTLVELVRQADAAFSSAFEETGMISASYAIIPSRQERANSAGLENLGSSIWPYVESRIQVMWVTIYQGAQRLSMIQLWLPYLLPLFIPAFIHGMCVREVKKVSYGYASPVVYHAALQVMMMLIFLPLFYVSLPISIHPAAVLVWGIALSICFVFISSNIQKQV